MLIEAIKRNSRKQTAKNKNLWAVYPHPVRKFKTSRRSGTNGAHPRSVNLYEFIRLILGPGVNDTEISRRWRMDQKNFSQFKNGITPVPRLERLIELARLLGVNKHLVFEVASGTPADKVFRLIKNNNLPGQTKLLFEQRR